MDGLRNGHLYEAHATRLDFYSDASLYTSVLFSHALRSETGTQIQRQLRSVELNSRLFVAVSWLGLPVSADNNDPLHEVYTEVTGLGIKILKRKNTLQQLAAEVRRELGLPNRGL